MSSEREELLRSLFVELARAYNDEVVGGPAGVDTVVVLSRWFNGEGFQLSMYATSSDTTGPDVARYGLIKWAEALTLSLILSDDNDED